MKKERNKETQNFLTQGGKRKKERRVGKKKSKEKEWIERLQTLENQINYWTDPDNKTDNTVEIIQLYYDAGKPAGCPAPHPVGFSYVCLNISFSYSPHKIIGVF